MKPERWLFFLRVLIFLHFDHNLPQVRCLHAPTIVSNTLTTKTTPNLFLRSSFLVFNDDPPVHLLQKLFTMRDLSDLRLSLVLQRTSVLLSWLAV